MNKMDDIVEARITEAMHQGEFDNLPGCGKPLQLDDDQMVPESLRLAHRILKNSGHLPPQVGLRREITEVGCLLANADDACVRNAAAKRLNALMIMLNICDGQLTDLRLEQQYYDKLVGQFTG